MKRLILFIIVLMLAGGMLFFLEGEADEGNDFQAANLKARILGNIFSDKSEAPFGQFPQNSDIGLGGDYRTYANKKYNFTFQYPEGLNVSEFQEGEGDIVLAQNAKTQNHKSQIQNIGFQFFIMPFDEEEPITAERIKQDLPDMKINNPQNVVIGKDDIRALIFFSDDSGLGKIREVWFVRRGNLYQISTYAETDDMIGEMLGTLDFD